MQGPSLLPQLVLLVARRSPRPPPLGSPQARILYTKRDPASALTIFQFVLAQKPDLQPDPRVGIGLCYWVLGSRQQAKGAWRRSLELVRPPGPTFALPAWRETTPR